MLTDMITVYQPVTLTLIFCPPNPSSDPVNASEAIVRRGSLNPMYSPSLVPNLNIPFTAAKGTQLLQLLPAIEPLINILEGNSRGGTALYPNTLGSSITFEKAMPRPLLVSSAFRRT